MPYQKVMCKDDLLTKRFKKGEAQLEKKMEVLT